MDYTRFRLRRGLIEIISDIPDNITITDVQVIVNLVDKVKKLYHELTEVPFEYSSEATVEEHSDLIDIFSKTLSLLENIFQAMLLSFRSGNLDYKIEENSIKIRDELIKQLQGGSITSKLLTKFSIK